MKVDKEMMVSIRQLPVDMIFIIFFLIFIYKSMKCHELLRFYIHILHFG